MSHFGARHICSNLPGPLMEVGRASSSAPGLAWVLGLLMYHKTEEADDGADVKENGEKLRMIIVTVIVL